MYYGFLSGFAYTVPYSIFGLFSGYLTRSNHRSLILCAIIALTSCSHLLSGFTSSFALICACRVFHGALSSATDPLSYSLVADYFPPDKRGTPNAILSSGNFIGIALSCMSILFIKSYGWRSTYIIMGAVGMLFSSLGLLIVRDARQNKEMKAPKETRNKRSFGEFINRMKEINKSLTCRYILAAGAFRSFGNMAVSCYLPVFF